MSYSNAQTDYDKYLQKTREQIKRLQAMVSELPDDGLEGVYKMKQSDKLLKNDECWFVLVTEGPFTEFIAFTIAVDIYQANRQFNAAGLSSITNTYELLLPRDAI